MTIFKLDALVSWESLLPKELLQFDAPEPRRVRLAFMTNAPVEVWASHPVEAEQVLPTGEVVEADAPIRRDVLVAYGSGQFETEFTTHGQTFVRVLAPEDTAVFVRGFAPDMRVPESDGEVYTSIMPRERRNTEFDRMVMWTKLNEARREKQLQDAIAALKASAPTEPAAEPVTEPATEGAADGA